MIITTELVEGPTVADKLLRGPLPWVTAVALTRQVLSALAYAHQQRIVHRDISPENIIVGSGGVVKLTNFALAKGTGSPKLTQVGLAIGNLKYISPEQIKGMGEVDARSDLYSLGMLLYEMLCGRPAFDLESQFELMAAQVNRPPMPPNVVNPAVPRQLAAVVLKALAKDPAERYQTAAEFDEALATVGGAPRPAQAEPPPEAAAAPPALAGDRSTIDLAETPSPSGFRAGRTGGCVDNGGHWRHRDTTLGGTGRATCRHGCGREIGRRVRPGCGRGCYAIGSYTVRPAGDRCPRWSRPWSRCRRSSPLSPTLPCRGSSSSLAVPPVRVWACCWWSSGLSSNDGAAADARRDARRCE